MNPFLFATTRIIFAHALCLTDSNICLVCSYWFRNACAYRLVYIVFIELPNVLELLLVLRVQVRLRLELERLLYVTQSYLAPIFLALVDCHSTICAFRLGTSPSRLNHSNCFCACTPLPLHFRAGRYSGSSSSSSFNSTAVIVPIIFVAIIIGGLFWRRHRAQMLAAAISSAQGGAQPTQVIGYPGAMAPAPVAGVEMRDGNMVATKTFSAGAHAPVPLGQAHSVPVQSGYPGVGAMPPQQQYQPYGGTYAVPAQQHPTYAVPVQYMQAPGQQQQQQPQQQMPQSNAHLPPSIASAARASAPEAKRQFFSPGEANSQQPQQQQHGGYTSHTESHAFVSGQVTPSAPAPTYAFAAPAGAFASSAPPPAYASEHYDSVAATDAPGGGHAHALQPPQGFVASAPASAPFSVLPSSLSYAQVSDDHAPPPSYM